MMLGFLADCWLIQSRFALNRFVSPRCVVWCGVVWSGACLAGVGQEADRGEARHGPGHDLAPELHHSPPSP